MNKICRFVQKCIQILKKVHLFAVGGIHDTLTFIVQSSLLAFIKCPTIRKSQAERIQSCLHRKYPTKTGHNSESSLNQW